MFEQSLWAFAKMFYPNNKRAQTLYVYVGLLKSGSLDYTNLLREETVFPEFVGLPIMSSDEANLQKENETNRKTAFVMAFSLAPT